MKESELIESISRAVKEGVKEAVKTSPTADHIETPAPVSHSYIPGYKKCISGCGTENQEFKPSNVFCPTCHTPMGRVEEEPESGKDYPEIKPCLSCGGTKGKYISDNQFNSDE
jgi:hypothetical protein